MHESTAPGSGARIESHFDGIETLLDEDSRTVTADTIEDLSDLDALLDESTALVSARKAQRQGRKLTAEQQDLLEASRLAAEVNSWQGLAVYAHITKTSCQCGHHFEGFQGWYHLEHQRRGGGRRLIRKDCREGLPASRYITEVVVPYCHACAPQGLPVASLDDCDLLSALGEPELVNEGQGEFAFDEPELKAEIISDKLLEELEEELEDETI